MSIVWQFAHFEELRPRELYALLQARQNVFILEQACLYPDIDGYDQNAHHLIGWRDGKLAATLRVIAPGVKYKEASLGRVMSAPEERRTGAGRELMAEGIRRLESLYPGQRIRIGAQQYLEKFYSSFGFVTVGTPYDEDGIMHVEMLR